MASSLPSESGGQTRFLDFRRNRKRMWRLFELFVANFLAREQGPEQGPERPAFRVSGQSRVDWHGAEERSPGALEHLPRMHPDVVAEGAGRPAVACLANRQAARPTGPRHEGILLFASTGEDLRIDPTLQGFRLQARTLDLSRPWPEIRRELLGVLE